MSDRDLASVVILARSALYSGVKRVSALRGKERVDVRKGAFIKRRFSAALAVLHMADLVFVRYTREVSANMAETHIFARCSGRFHLCTRWRTL